VRRGVRKSGSGPRTESAMKKNSTNYQTTQQTSKKDKGKLAFEEKISIPQGTAPRLIRPFGKRWDPRPSTAGAVTRVRLALWEKRRNTHPKRVAQ